MTAVVALTDGAKVYMGADSFCGDEKKKDVCLSPKVYKVGSLGVGLCGLVRQELILEKNLRRLIEKEDIKITHEWLKFELPNILVKDMKENLATVEEKNQATLGQSAYMLAFEGKIYYLDNDFGIWDSSRRIASIGIGQQYALGALTALEQSYSTLTPKEKLLRALQAAHEWSIYVEPPYTFIEV